MSDTAQDLQLRLDAIRRRIDGARQTVAAGDSVDLGDLTGEVQTVCEMLRAAPLQIDRERAARDIEEILVGLNALEAELRAHHQRLIEGTED